MLKRSENPDKSGKKLILTLTIAILLATTLLAQLQEPVRKIQPIKVKLDKFELSKYNAIPPPEWEIVPDSGPNALITSYYDYMPGSYCSHPLRKQHGSGPRAGEGTYMIFTERPTQTDNRRVYWAYVGDDDVSITGPGIITTYDKWQGYPGIDILDEIGSDNPVVAWHEDYDGDGTVETSVTWDNFDFLGTPGFWQDVYPIENEPDNEFLFPYVYSGESPLGAGYSRVYVVRTNFFGSVQIKYKDVQSSFEINTSGWQNLTEEPIFSDWIEQNIHPFQSFNLDTQTPGRIALIGYAEHLDNVPPNPPVEEGFFVYESLDYGETWTLYDFGKPPAIDNLLGLEDNQGNVLDSIEVSILGFNNTALFDGDGNLHYCYTGCYGFTGQDGYFYYFDYFIPACEFVWFGGDDVGWRNVYPEVPWEVVSGDTLIHWSCAVSTNDPDLIFHENTQKQAVNLENGWMIQVWSDGRFIFGYPQPPYEPCICISVSSDNGFTWTEPIIIDMSYPMDYILVYPYVADEIVDANEYHPYGDWGRIYMYYFNDNDYGSYVLGQGPNTGGQITYMAIDINYWTPPPPPYRWLYFGWNWISFNIHPDDTSIEYVFSSVEGHIYQVKNRTQSATYIDPPGIWIGDLTHITDGEGYLVYSYDTVGLYISGMLIPPDTPIYLNEDWNWIAYFPQVPLSVVPDGYALQSIEPNAYQIKNQTRSATWIDPPGIWIGDLTIMEPTVGYKLNMLAPDTLIYPTDCKKQQIVSDRMDNKPLNWQLMSGTQYNMVAIAELGIKNYELGGSNEELGIGVFDGEGNCRSIGVRQNLNGNDFWYFTIVGNEEIDEQKELYFKIYDKETDKIYRIGETILFADNTTVGSPDEPILLTLSTLVENESRTPSITKLYQNYPNPFPAKGGSPPEVDPLDAYGGNPETTISFTLNQKDAKDVRVNIYNIKGELVKVLECGESLATKAIPIKSGLYSIIWNGTDNHSKPVPSGIYFYQLKVDDEIISTKKCVLMK